MKPMTWEDALKVNGTPGYTGRDCLESYEKIREARRQPKDRDRRTWANLGNEERTCSKHGAFKSTLQQLQGAPDNPMFAPRWTTCPACDLEIEAEQRETSEASAEMRRALEKLRLVNASMPEMYLASDIRDWFSEDKRIKRVWLGVKNYLETLEAQIDRGRNLVFVGNPGTGKTMLACIVLRHLLLKLGGTGKYVTQSRLTSRIKLTMDRDRATESEDQVFNDLSMVDLLVLDEVGRGSTSDWEKSILFRLIDERYQRRTKPIILISNLDAKALRTYVSEAAMDRLNSRGSTVVEFLWNSLRDKEDKPRQVEE